eukprot:3547044-Prymnesium_polylepis.3
MYSSVFAHHSMCLAHRMAGCACHPSGFRLQRSAHTLGDNCDVWDAASCVGHGPAGAVHEPQ